MKFKAHDYQKYVIEYIKTHPICMIILQMGLGKSVSSATAVADMLFDTFEVHKVLIIAPLRVGRDTWPAEFKKWDHLNNIRYSVAIGTEAQRREALKMDADVYIINRDVLPWLVDESGISCDFDTIIIDEISASFSNGKSKRYRALMKIRPFAKRVIGLTGTPLANADLQQLFYQYLLLDMGERFSRFITKFRDCYLRPDKRNGSIIYSYKPLPGAVDEVYKKISDITISMKSVDHLKMPELITTNVEVELSDSELKKYKAFKDELTLELEGGEVTADNAAALAGKLIQIAGGAVYNDDKEVIKIHDRKLDALEDIIESCGGPLLISYWYKHELSRIKERFDVREILTSKDIEEWNEGKIPVGIIHPVSAGYGLNLQGCSHNLVFMTLPWALDTYQQTIARLWRQGQQSDTVVVQHIICKGTMDEKILSALENKNTSQEKLLEAVKACL